MPNNIQNWDMAYAVTFKAINKKLEKFNSKAWDAEHGNEKIVCNTTPSWTFVGGGDIDEVLIKIPLTCNYTKTENGTVSTTNTNLGATIKLNLKWLKQRKEPSANSISYVELITFTTNQVSDELLKDSIKSLFSTIIDNTKPSSKSFLEDLSTFFDSLNIFQQLAQNAPFKWMSPTTIAYATIDSNDLEPNSEDSVFGILCMTNDRKNKEKPAIDINIIPEKNDSAIIITPTLLMQKILRPAIQTLFKDGTFQEQGGTAFINTKDMHFQTTFKNKKGDEIDPLIKEKSFICRIDNNSLVLNFGEMTYNWIQSWIWNWSLNDTGSVSLQRKCKGTFGKEAISKTGYMLMDSSSVTPLLNNKALHRTGLQVGLSQLPTVINAGYEWWRNRKEKNRFAEQLFIQREKLAGKYLFAGVDAFKIHKIIKYNKAEKTWLEKEMDKKLTKGDIKKIDEKEDVYCILHNSEEIFILKVNENNTQYGGLEFIGLIKRNSVLKLLDGDTLETALNGTASSNSIYVGIDVLTEPSWMNLNMKLLQSIRSILSDLVFNVIGGFDLVQPTFKDRLFEQKGKLQNKQIAIGDTILQIKGILSPLNSNYTDHLIIKNMTEIADNNQQNLFKLKLNDEYASYGGFQYVSYKTEPLLTQEQINLWMNTHQQLLLQLRDVLNHWLSLSLTEYSEFDFRKRLTTAINTKSSINPAGTIKTENFELEIMKLYDNGQNVFVILRETVNTSPKWLWGVRTNYTTDYIVLKLEITATAYGNLSFYKYIKESDTKKLNSDDVLSVNHQLATADEQAKIREWNNLYRNDLITIKSYLMEELKVPVLWHMHPYLKLGFKAALDNIISATTKNVASDVLAGGDIEGLEARIDDVLKTVVWPGGTGSLLPNLTLDNMDLDGNFRLSFKYQ